MCFPTKRIILTRRGKPLAALVPLEDLELLDALENAADAEDVHLAREEAGAPPPAPRGAWCGGPGEVVPWDTVKGEFGR